MTINEIFSKYLKVGPFCKAYTNIDPSKGLYHRLKGYDTAGRAADLTPEQREGLKQGLITFNAEIKTLIKTL